MVVKASVYAKQGGMNRRQAGEDFHFLQKIIPLGNFGDIHTTRVMPSGRTSQRVPFGTGKAMLKWNSSASDEYTTYNPCIFEELRVCLKGINGLYSSSPTDIQRYFEDLPIMLKNFIGKDSWIRKISAFQSQSASLQAFKDKFFQWMNGLKILRYVHYARDSGYQNVTVMEAYKWLNEKIQLTEIYKENVIDGLTALRKYDLKNPYFYKRT
jgi:hypothetical protein